MCFDTRKRMFQLVSTCWGQVLLQDSSLAPAQAAVQPVACDCRSYQLDTKRCHHRGWSFLADPTAASGVISGTLLDPAKMYSKSTTFVDMDLEELPIYTSPKLSPGECDLACFSSLDANLTVFPVKCRAWVRQQAAWGSCEMYVVAGVVHLCRYSSGQLSCRGFRAPVECRHKCRLHAFPLPLPPACLV